MRFTHVLMRAALALLATPPFLASGAVAIPGDTASGRLEVKVSDNWGILPGATVTATTRQTGVVRQGVTGADGRAVIEGVAPGTWDLTVSLTGFADGVLKGVVVAEGEAKSVTVTMTLVQFSTEVTVSTANRREEILLNVADPMTLIEKTAIEDVGARTAKDVLVEQTGAGVQVAAGGGQGHVSINGIPNSGVLVLIDGRRYLGKDANGNLNLEDIDLTGVERIEVVKGAGSALYGSDALGGVINIITKKGTLPGLTNSLSVNGGSYHDYRVGNTLGVRAGRGGLSASGGYRTYDGFDLDKGRNLQTTGQPQSKFRTAALNGDVKIADFLLARFVGNYLRRNIDNYYFAGATQLASSVYNSVRKLTRYTLSPEVDFLPTPDTAVNFSYTHGHYERLESQLYQTRSVVVAPWLEDNREFHATLRQAFSAFGQEHYLQAGYEFRRESLERASIVFPNTGQRKATRDLNVGWIQQELSLSSRVKVTGGFRYDSYSDFGSQLNPKVSAVFSVDDRQRVRASYGKGFRAPLFGELYLNTPPFFVGNPDLKPERSDTVTAGYAFGGARLQASGDVFRAKVKDGITFNLARLPYTYINLRSYTSTGFNGAVSVNLPLGFAPSVSYAYVRREDDAGARVGGLPEHSAILKLAWSNPRVGLRANLRGQFLGRATFDDQTSQPSYQVWHGQVNKKFITRGGTSFSVFAQVDNLFSEKDIFRRDAQGQPIQGDFQVWLAPRTFLAGVTFDVEWLRK